MYCLSILKSITNFVATSQEVYTDRISDIINEHNVSKPMFLYAAMQSVHSPLQVPKVRNKGTL